MFVYFSTVKRKRPVKVGGEFVKIEWETKEILNSVSIYPTEPDIVNDPNPRGNSRGGKGVLTLGNEIYVGTYHSIVVYDQNTFNVRRKITNNLFAGVHEIYFQKEDLWVSSTAIDGVVKVDPDGNLIRSWWPREDKYLQDNFGLFPLKINKNIDNRLLYLNEQMSTKKSHTHLNCVTGFEGRIYVLLNSPGLLIQIEPEFKIVVNDSRIIGAHSAKIIDNGKRVILCGSFSSSILTYDLISGELVNQADLQNFTEVKDLSQQYPDQPFNKSIFVRGLDIIDEERAFVGISPASILEINIRNNSLLDIFRYSSDVGDSVHGIAHSND